MTGGTMTSRTLAAHQELARRCMELGLPLVHTDESGALRRVQWAAGDAMGAEVLQRLVEAPEFDAVFRRAVANGSAASGAVSLLPGWFGAPLPIIERRETVGHVVALLLEPAGVEGPSFEALCESAGVEPEAASIVLRQAATHSAASVASIAELLQRALADRVELGLAEHAIEEFSAQLAESYEEISLFYSLGRAMKELVGAEDFMAHLCEQMHETLPFGWVAARFLKTGQASAALSGRTFREGGSHRYNLDQPAVLGEIVGQACEINTPETVVLALEEDGPEAICRIIQRDDETVGVLIAGEKQGADRSVSSVDMKLLDGAARLAEVVIANAALYEEQQRLFLGTLEALTSAIDAKDPYTCGHSQRVSELSLALARRIGLDPAQLETIRISGLVHDIGKIGVPERVLLKASRLTDEEFALIKLHPEIGHRILRDIPLLSEALPGVMHHHERWDGRGYPAGLAGEDIPLIARIIGVADAFDAMSSSRTYRAAMPRSTVLTEIRDNAGKQFDPDLASAFLELDLAFYDAMLAKVVRAVDSEAA